MTLHLNDDVILMISADVVFIHLANVAQKALSENSNATNSIIHHRMNWTQIQIQT